MNTKEAASFCGFSTSYFEKLAKRYKITRYGPKRTRFAQADLENFMAAPESFGTVTVNEKRVPIQIEV